MNKNANYTRSEDDITRDFLHKIREINARANAPRVLNEEKNGGSNTEDEDAIAITDDPRFGQQALTNQIQQFRSAVESGAQFSKPKDGKVSESPLIYMPGTGNMVFSGTIPCLNNLKWQFVLKTSTGSGCFIYADGLILNKDNLAILNKLQGFYQNWREQWNAESADLDRMVQNMKDNN